MTLKQKEKINLGKHRLIGGKKRKIQLKVINKFLVVMIVFLGVYFVASVNDLAIKGFVLKELKVKAGELENVNNNVELSIMDLESYESISEKAKNLEMVKVDKIDYITLTDGAVAKK